MLMNLTIACFVVRVRCLDKPLRVYTIPSTAEFQQGINAIALMH
ncbi:MAG: hypothetical protein RMX68_027855 [Aulosira sp. ZfuVER01]|nr:hypothetical protein [Aulosira sp. ZfuVER01]MDZ8000662.1 hypothetical protein [Aulosira sp. DedVER01a]MDZ8051777.1 hypothetical protein [Aulosira sp. ZfuCHP01]